MWSGEQETNYCPHRQFIPEIIGVAVIGSNGEEVIFPLAPNGDDHWCRVKEKIYQEFGLGLGRCSSPHGNGRACPWYTFGPATVTSQSFNRILDHFIEEYFQKQHGNAIS